MTYSRSLLVASLMLIACNSGGDEGSGDPPPDAAGGANTTFQWTITQSGVATTCAGADVDEVQIEASPETGVPILHTFQCVLLPGTLAMAPGRYAVAAKLYSNRNGQTRAFVPAQSLTVPPSGTSPAMTFNFTL